MDQPTTPAYRDSLEAMMNERFVFHDDTRATIAGSALADGSGVHELLRRFHAGFPEGADRRGTASMWGARYIDRFTEAAVGASILLDRSLPISFRDVALIVGDDDRTIAAMRMKRTETNGSEGNVFERLHILLRENFAPLIDHISSWAGMSPRVLWGTAAHYVYWKLQILNRQPEISAQRIEDHYRLFTSRSWPDGWRNPLFDPIRWLDGRNSPRHERRVCCLIYLLPDHGLCGKCPCPPRQREQAVAKANKQTALESAQ